MLNRYDRNEKFFGKHGQNLIEKSTVAIVGVGGIGTHVLQQLAYLGVGTLVLIDKEEIDRSNLNRYVIACPDDLNHNTVKVEIAEKVALRINPEIKIIKINQSFISHEAFNAIKKVDYVFGCLDREGVRFILNELCAAYEIPYFDLASDIIPGERVVYGGRLFCCWDGSACLCCMEVLDMSEVQKNLGGSEHETIRKSIYGVDDSLLSDSGPSVVSINGLVASLAVTEFIVGITGMRKPVVMATYRGADAKVLVNNDLPGGDCYYCNHIRGLRERADVHRYINGGVGEWL